MCKALIQDLFSVVWFIHSHICHMFSKRVPIRFRCCRCLNTPPAGWVMMSHFEHLWLWRHQQTMSLNLENRHPSVSQTPSFPTGLRMLSKMFIEHLTCWWRGSSSLRHGRFAASWRRLLSHHQGPQSPSAAQCPHTPLPALWLGPLHPTTWASLFNTQRESSPAHMMPS